MTIVKRSPSIWELHDGKVAAKPEREVVHMGKEFAREILPESPGVFLASLALY